MIPSETYLHRSEDAAMAAGLFLSIALVCAVTGWVLFYCGSEAMPRCLHLGSLFCLYGFWCERYACRLAAALAYAPPTQPLSR